MGAEICVRAEFLLDLLNEVGGHRALADHETDLLEDIVGMEITAFAWNQRLEAALMVAASSPGGIRRFAHRHGMTDNAAYQKLSRLRRRKMRYVRNSVVKG